MFCKNCGAELKEGAKFCSTCGMAASAAPSIRQSAPVQTAEPAEQHKSKNDGTDKRRTFLKLLLVIGMACFIFPFVTVSCAGESENITGLDAMLATFIAEEYKDTYDYSPNPYLLAAFGLGIAGLVVVWKNKKLIIAGWTSLIGALALFLFRITLVSFYDLRDALSLIDIKFRWGWLLSFLAYLASAVIALRPLGQFKENGINSSDDGRPPENHTYHIRSKRTFPRE